MSWVRGATTEKRSRYWKEPEKAAPEYDAIALQRVRILAWRGDTDEALRQLEQLPGDVLSRDSAILLRARLDLWSENYEAAITSFDVYLRSSPSDSDALYGRGTALYELERFQSALSDLDRACEDGVSSACDLATDVRREIDPPLLSSIYAQGRVQPRPGPRTRLERARLTHLRADPKLDH